MRAADGQQHVARVQGAGGAGGAGGGADALAVQQQQHGLALDALEAEAHVAGQTVGRGRRSAAQCGIFAQPGDELVPQGRDLALSVLLPYASQASRRAAAMPGDAAATFSVPARLPRSWAPPSMRGRQGHALADIQQADAPRAVELVAGQGQHVDVHACPRRWAHGRQPAPHRCGTGRRVRGTPRRSRAIGWIVPISLLAYMTRHQAGILADGVRDLLRP